MKTLVLTLSLYFSIFATCVLYAGNTALISNYPATTASYNKITLTTQPGASGTPRTCNASTVGMLSMDPNTASSTYATLQLCALVKNNVGVLTPTVVPFGTACFNRYCTNANYAPAPSTSCPNGAAGFHTAGPANDCPTGFVQVIDPSTGAYVNDTFLELGLGGANYNVYSTVCCYGPSSSAIYYP